MLYFEGAQVTNVRYHVVQEFNKGVYDYIIASDENAHGSEQDPNNSEDEANEHEDEDESEEGNCQYSPFSMLQPLNMP